MSHRFGPPLLTGAHIHGNSGLGVLAELVPSTGEHGPGIASTWLGPAEAGKEVRVLITQWPEVGSLFVWEDTSFEYNGPGGTAYAQLYVEGQPVDTPQTVAITVGATLTLDSITHADITTSGATAQVAITRSGPTPAGTLYVAVYPAATTPTFTGGAWSGPPAYQTTATARTTTGTQDVAVSGLAASTSYKTWAAWSDGTTTVGPVGSGAWSTAAITVEVSFRSIILEAGVLTVLPIGQEGTGKKPIALLDGNLKERVGSEGVPIILDAGALRTLGQGESLVS